MRILAALILAVGVLCATTAQTPTPSPSPVDIAKNYVDTMLRTGHADPAWFSASFLAQVPASKIDEIIASLTAALGAYESIEVTPTRLLAHFARGTDDVLIGLDTDHKIKGILFKEPVTASLDDALHGLQTMPGTVSYVVTEEGGAERAAFNASAQLAIGSAFKLAVLNALRDEIAAGSYHWTDVEPLREEWKSLPSGILQGWPDRTPLTLATYAAEMISISDNTAANAMIRIVGAKALAKYAGSNQPFITTREAFILKSNEGTTLRQAYSSAPNANGRASVLARVDKLPLPTLDMLLTTPDLAVEWHYSVRDLCALMARVADLPLMSISPGVAKSGEFLRVAYKGGSDFGVMNMTTMVTTKRGTKLCFSATVNNTEHDIDETAFALGYRAALDNLATL